MNDERYIEEQLDKENRIKEKFNKLNFKDVGISKDETALGGSKIWEILLNVILAFATLAIIGLAELFSPDWEWAIYASSTFWISYGLTQSASWFARVWIYVTRLKKHQLTDKHYENINNHIQVYVDKDFEEPFIEVEANIDNFRRKKRAWTTKQKRKLVKLSNHYRVLNILPVVKEINNIDLDKSPFKMETDYVILKRWCEFKWFWSFRVKLFEKTKSRVSSKINRVLKTITDEWVENNLETIKIKYHKVSRIILTNGYTAKNSDDNTPDYKENKGHVFVKYTIPAFVFASIFMFLIVPLRGEFNNTASAWFQFITKALIVFMSGAFMWKSSQEIFDQTIKKASDERLSTLNNYAKKHEKAKNIKNENV